MKYECKKKNTDTIKSNQKKLIST